MAHPYNNFAAQTLLLYINERIALDQTNKLVWIVETIYKAGKITFDDLNRKWMENTDLSGGEEI